ncbi:hypothetical protein OG401_40170 [Kitasatospora purpeofusca]|uniref:hypothetical protein n=1 Tax=Kitasatospora purpeofusca TaxID=67352 RepID=UPI002252C65C|nr:hypothetical protein [Kitasatospora purpeofusca]MCX4690441.1 hypothetical protein [Kitasatospora purpeofusca]
MDIDEVAERITTAGSSADVMPGFLPVLIDVDEADPMVTVHLGSLLDIDLRPVGDWSNYGFSCGGFSFEGMPAESAISAVLLIATGKAGVRTTGKWIFREQVLEFTIDGEEWRDFRSLSHEVPLWEQRLSRSMAERSVEVEQVVYPCILLDDDDWLISCAGSDEVRQASEPDFLSDIREAFDAEGKPLRLFVVGGKGDGVDFEVAGPPRPELLRRCVESFFQSWTDAEPPAFTADTVSYALAVAQTAESVPIRKRKRPDPEA